MEGIMLQLDQEPWCRPVIIGDDECPFGILCLDFAVKRNLTSAGLKVVADARQGRFMHEEAPLEKTSNQPAGQVIGCGPQASCQNNGIGAAQRFPDRVHNGRAFIADRYLAMHLVAQFIELSAEPLMMRVEHAADHELAARIDNFNCHAAKKSCF